MPPKRRATGGDPQQRDKAWRAKAMAKHAAENHTAGRTAADGRRRPKQLGDTDDAARQNKARPGAKARRRRSEAAAAVDIVGVEEVVAVEVPTHPEVHGQSFKTVKGSPSNLLKRMGIRLKKNMLGNS